MISSRNPASMTPDERRSEVAFLLAVGYRRLCLARRNQLDLSRSPEALSGVLNGREDAPGKEKTA